MTEIERFLNAILLKQVDRVPVASVTQTGTIELMKTTGAFWPDAHRDPEKMATLAAAIHDIAGFESIRVPFGIHAEAEALGCRVNYYEGSYDRTPYVEAPIDETAINRKADPRSSKSTGAVIDAVRLLKSRYPETPIVAGVLAPFTLTGHIRSVAKLMRELIKSPEDVKKTMDYTSEFISSYIAALEDGGADVIALVEPTATGENLGPVLFEKFASPHLERIVRGCSRPTILHICGNSTTIIPIMVRTGVKGISIDHKVSVSKAKELVANKASVIGNINPVDIMMKKKEDVQNAALSVMAEGTDVVAPGCGLAPRTPTINLKAIAAVVKSNEKDR